MYVGSRKPDSESEVGSRNALRGVWDHGGDGRWKIHAVSCGVRSGRELLRTEKKVKTGIKICKNRVDNPIKMWYYMHKGGEKRLGLVYLYLYSYKK